MSITKAIKYKIKVDGKLIEKVLAPETMSPTAKRNFIEQWAYKRGISSAGITMDIMKLELV